MGSWRIVELVPDPAKTSGPGESGEARLHQEPNVRQPVDEVAEARAPRRRAIHLYRRSCLSCGRATEGATVASGAGRCGVCGGTMLTEHAVSE